MEVDVWLVLANILNIPDIFCLISAESFAPLTVFFSSEGPKKKGPIIH